jgi:putative tricarboxylic transport membrane protein
MSRGDPAILLSSPITWLFAALIVFVLVVVVRRELAKAQVRRAGQTR